ncbi:hypothetical protein A71_234 [Escherichia phage A7_1]|uniref:Uncharacterized protein n=2 Tax=Vequintavirinae TaxID=1911928 RepID=A0AAE9VX94_9CAUD|nr:hypothetical protein [Escherichia phage UPEC06]UZZ64040.1 hypothetical protein A71_234 [Escherichia phage A7_1]UZZ64317.1 hypothetical protein A54_77 [Escherichia phage A5-4]WBF77662.1 hypothetical protein A73_28 [Escherichia phage A73]WBF77932.1 hypothetical protein W70_8 [Escherichia phage W70]
MTELIATTKIEGVNDVTLSYDPSTLVYVVKYGRMIAELDCIDEAFEKYFELINIAYDDYR